MTWNHFILSRDRINPKHVIELMDSLVTVFNVHPLHSCFSRQNGMSVCRYYANSLECTLQDEQVNLTAVIVVNLTGGNLASYDTLRRHLWIEIWCVSVNGFAQAVSRIWGRDCGTIVNICDKGRYDYSLILIRSQVYARIAWVNYCKLY